jgi:uncharacterized protein YjbJ (UPF0337 family)
MSGGGSLRPTTVKGNVVDESTKMRVEGKWDQMKGRAREAWGAVTDDDWDRTEGKYDRIVGTIKEKTGEQADAIERRLHDMLD